jgi:chlorophyll synthase
MQGFSPAAMLELLKPVTWFAPMWAFVCGVVSSGLAIADNWLSIAAGILLAGPLVCGTSQVVNDWYDRHVDAINQPDRPIPSGRMPGRSGLVFACAWTLLSLGVAWLLGPWVFWAAAVGMLLAWLYSAPPVRLKRNGWWGNLAVAGCYEGLPWFAGAALMAANFPRAETVILAVLYSLGAHGIMTVNDFKSVEGDLRMGIRTLPVQLGIGGAARLTCFMMLFAQSIVIIALWTWGQPLYAGAVAVLSIAQVAVMPTFINSPRERAPWFNGTGISLYVLGMLVSAFAVRSLPPLS